MARPAKVVVLGDVSDALRELGKLERGIGNTESVFTRVGKTTVKALAGITTAIAGVTAVVGGLAIKGGIDRALKTEAAIVQMRRLGISVEDIDSLVKTVDKTFDGTVFTNPEGFALTQRLIGAGESLDAIPERLRTIADFAAHGNVPLDQMGDIFERIIGSGRVTAKELNRLSDAQIPLGALAETLGLTIPQLRKITEQGEFTTEMFLDAAASAKMFQGAAKSAGDTTQGAFKNVLSQMARLGELVVGPMFGENGPMVRVFKAARQALIDLRPMLTQVGETLGNFLVPKIEALAEWLKGGGLPRLVTNMGGVFDNLKSTLVVLGGPLALIVRQLFPLIEPLLKAILPPLAEMANSLAPSLGKTLQWLSDEILPGFIKMVSAVLGWITDNKGLVVALGLAVVAFKVLAAVMAINPFILLATAVIGIVSLIITNWDTIKSATSSVANWIVDKFNFVIGFFKGLPGRVAAATRGMFDGLRNAFRSAVNWIIGKWNNFSLGIGSFRLNTPNIPYLHSGGVFHAPPGQSEGLAMLRDRERVVTPEQDRAQTRELHLLSDGTELDSDSLVASLLQWQRRNGPLPFTT